MKVKLFHWKNLLVSAKGLVSSILTGISGIPLWALSYFFMRKGMFVLGGIFTLFFFVWYLFFWGFISRLLWKWNGGH